jgi:hypothetical protein
MAEHIAYFDEADGSIPSPPTNSDMTEKGKSLSALP